MLNRTLLPIILAFIAIANGKKKVDEKFAITYRGEFPPQPFQAFYEAAERLNSNIQPRSLDFFSGDDDENREFKPNNSYDNDADDDDETKQASPSHHQSHGYDHHGGGHAQFTKKHHYVPGKGYTTIKVPVHKPDPYKKAHHDGGYGHKGSHSEESYNEAQATNLHYVPGKGYGPSNDHHFEPTQNANFANDDYDHSGSHHQPAHHHQNFDDGSYKPQHHYQEQHHESHYNNEYHHAGSHQQPYNLQNQQFDDGSYDPKKYEDPYKDQYNFQGAYSDNYPSSNEASFVEDFAPSPYHLDGTYPGAHAEHEAHSTVVHTKKAATTKKNSNHKNHHHHYHGKGRSYQDDSSNNGYGDRIISQGATQREHYEPKRYPIKSENFNRFARAPFPTHKPRRRQKGQTKFYGMNGNGFAPGSSAGSFAAPPITSGLPTYGGSHSEAKSHFTFKPEAPKMIVSGSSPISFASTLDMKILKTLLNLS